MESKQSSIIKIFDNISVLQGPSKGFVVSSFFFSLNLSLVHGKNLTEYHPTNRRVAHW